MTRKRFMKYLLSFVAVFAMAVALVGLNVGKVSAESNASITINNSISGEKYTYYKILNASVGSNVTTDQTSGKITSGNVSYTVDNETKANALKNLQLSDSNETKIFTVEQSGDKWNVTLNKSLTTEPTGEVMAARLNKILNNFTSQEATSNGDTLTINNLEPGYYLIKSSLGTNLVAQTIGNVTINEKNDKPSTTKTVDKNNYSIGDFVNYTIKVNLPESVDYTKPVIVHDTMDNVLTVNSDKYNQQTNPNGWKATVKNSNNTGESDFSDNVVISGSKANNHDSSTHVIGANQVGYDFVLDINSLKPTNPTGKVITINYKAELKKEAKADTDYINKEYVQYSNYTTPTQEVKIKTFDLDLKKNFTGSTNQEILEATFELKKAGASDAIKFKKEDPASGENYTAKYVKADNNDTTTTEDLVIRVHGGENGINIRGLDAGNYVLTETATASGYNKLVNPVTFSIDDSGNIRDVKNGTESLSAENNTITVVNNAGSVLPSTGGMGTKIFYTVGALVVAAAVVLLIKRKKASKAE